MTRPAQLDLFAELAPVARCHSCAKDAEAGSARCSTCRARGIVGPHDPEVPDIGARMTYRGEPGIVTARFHTSDGRDRVTLTYPAARVCQSVDADAPGLAYESAAEICRRLEDRTKSEPRRCACGVSLAGYGDDIAECVLCQTTDDEPDDDEPEPDSWEAEQRATRAWLTARATSRHYCGKAGGCAGLATVGDLCTFHAEDAPAADLFATVNVGRCNYGTPKIGEDRPCDEPATHVARWATYAAHPDDERDEQTNGIACCVDHANYYACAWGPQDFAPGARGAAWLEPLKPTT